MKRLFFFFYLHAPFSQGKSMSQTYEGLLLSSQYWFIDLCLLFLYNIVAKYKFRDKCNFTFPQDCTGYRGVLLFHTYFVLSVFTNEECHWNFEINCIEFVQCFQLNDHFKNSVSSNPWTCSIFCFFVSFIFNDKIL